jgi:hypothetical protein
MKPPILAGLSFYSVQSDIDIWKISRMLPKLIGRVMVEIPGYDPGASSLQS